MFSFFTFSRSPQKGIKYLIENGAIPGHAFGIAEFLLDADELSRQAIGEYFGRLSDPCAMNVLT